MAFPGHPIQKLQQLLQGNQMPSPTRSLMMQRLLAQNQSRPQGTLSTIGGINRAMEPILAALLAKQEERANATQQAREQASLQQMMAALQRGDTEMASGVAGGLPNNPMAQLLLQNEIEKRYRQPEPQETWNDLTPEQERELGIPESSFAQRNSLTGQVQIDDAPNALVDLNIDTASDEFKDLPNSLQEAVIGGMDRADASRRQAQEMRVMRDMATGADTGLLTPVTLPIKQAFESIGVSLDDDVPLLESMRAQQNQLALRMRNPDSGFGLTGSTSDRDLRFLKESVPGLANTPQGNTAIAMIMEAKMRRDADLEELRANYIQEHRGYQGWTQARQEWVDSHPFFSPEEQTFILSLSSPGANLEGFNELSPEEQRELIELERRNSASQIQ